MSAALVPDVAPEPAATSPQPRTRTTSRHARGATTRLLVAELRLLLRDPLTLTFAFAFPVVTMLIIGGSFGRAPDDSFGGVDPAHWYVASYLTATIAATGLVTVPVRIAGYRERGVLRRYAAAGFPRWSFATAQLAVGLLTVLLGGALLLAVAAPVYGVPAVDDVGRVVAGLVAGSVLFVALGVLLGSVLPSARAAQAVGLVLFFPSFLLGSGGPPPAVMGSALRHVADVLPLTEVTRAVREPWLGIGPAGVPLAVVSGLALVALAAAVRRTRV